ncbi:MAG: RICIN domain-containing protein [Clostridia bacterium]|nr:RICIN domain-containing protein [Clostridia bacterium]
MNIDFHYYGTYTAARLAGYDFRTAQSIAYAAQYVDDSSMEVLKDDYGKYYIPDFKPTPTVQTNKELFESNFSWSEENLNETARVWSCFHFLPGNYESNAKIAYTGSKQHKGNSDYWEYDGESSEQFKLLCLPNSQLVKKMINDIIDNHKGKDYEMHLAGLRMHVLADTWAHMYYAGIPAWFINNAGDKVYDISNGRIEVKWRRIWPLTDIFSGEEATPDALAYNSYVYLGHGRMGHLPDYPWIKYEYSPQWAGGSIIKDNPTSFMLAFKQMVAALRCIRERRSFDINVYENIGQQNEAIINGIINTKTNDQRAVWKNNIGKIKTNNISLEVPEEYDANNWLNTMKGAGDRRNTDYYRFNFSALFHMNFINSNLRGSHIFIDEIPAENIVKVKIRNVNGSYIGPVENWGQYSPKMGSNGIELNIVKPNSKPLESGDIVKIRTNEEKARGYNYLGAWATKALYYYSKDYTMNKQRWRLEKVGGSVGQEIKSGDLVKITNRFYLNMPYMIPYRWLGYGDYLTTTGNSQESNALWHLEFGSEQYYNIVAKYSGKVLDVYDGSMDDEAKIIQYHGTGGDNQKFKLVPSVDGYYQIQAKHSGRVLDVYGGSMDDEAQIIQYHNTGGDNQKFKLVPSGGGYYQIQAKHSGKVLDVYGGSMDDEAKIIQYHSTGGDNQKFKFVPVN